jgi:predicted membrane channel-forming protein YqfA (hemolysin III family)
MEGYSTGLLTLFFFIFVLVLGVIFYALGVYLYDNPTTWRQFDEWEAQISNAKRKIKGLEKKECFVNSMGNIIQMGKDKFNEIINWGTDGNEEE